MKRNAAVLAIITGMLLAASCSPPEERTPALTPENAVALLQAHGRAKDWITYAQKQDSTCEWHLELPDQSAHPVEIDVDHIIQCRVTRNPRELDASVQFTFDRVEKRWTISAFRS